MNKSEDQFDDMFDLPSNLFSKETPIYHGTGAALSVGDVIEPRNHRVAHATTNVNQAKDFADFSKYAESSHQVQLPLFGSVYRVEPVDAEEASDTTIKEHNRRMNSNTRQMLESFPSSGNRYSEKGFRVTGLEGLV